MRLGNVQLFTRFTLAAVLAVVGCTPPVQSAPGAGADVVAQVPDASASFGDSADGAALPPDVVPAGDGDAGSLVDAETSGDAPTGPAPVLTQLSAQTASHLGGGLVWLSGSNLTDAQVFVGGHPATVVVPSATRPGVIPPPVALAAGVDALPVSVTVQTAGGKAELAGKLTVVRETAPVCEDAGHVFALDTKAAAWKGPKSPKEVLLAALFTGWKDGALALGDGGQDGDATAGDGVWSRAVPVFEEALEYKFVVDGQWYNDPTNPEVAPPFGNSRVVVDGPCTPDIVFGEPAFGAVVTASTLTVSATVVKGLGAGSADVVGASVVARFDGAWVPLAYDAASGKVLLTLENLASGRHTLRLSALARDGTPAAERWTEFYVEAPAAVLAHAGDLQFARAGDTVLLDGTRSKSPTGAALTTWAWSWLQTPGPQPTFAVAHATDWKGYQFEPKWEPQKSASRVWTKLDQAGIWRFAVQASATGSDGKATASSNAGNHGAVVVLAKGGGFLARPALAVTVDGVNDTVGKSGKAVVVTAAIPGAADAVFTWYQDPANPQLLDGTIFKEAAQLQLPGTDDALDVSALKAPGTYFFYAVGKKGDALSEQGTAMIQVRDVAGAKAIAAWDFERAPDWLARGVTYEVFARHWRDGKAVELTKEPPGVLRVRVGGDDSGDLRGLREQLPYLKSLGITTLWLMPMLQSADHQHGYHVTDYERVDWDLGDDSDLVALNQAAHALGLHVLIDYVINHSSRFHPWFERALADPEGKTRYRDFYIWCKDGSHGFGRDIYYKKLGVELGWGDIPDLNLANPFVFNYFLDVAKAWMDPNGDGNFEDGVDGFRLDHVTGPDHQVWKAMRRELKAFRPDVALIAEAFTGMAGIADYYHGEFDFSFTFPFYYAAMAVVRDGGHAGDNLGGMFAEVAKASPTGALACPFTSNHDVPWLKTLYGDLGKSDAKMLALAQLALSAPGAPQLLYGDELGLLEHRGPMPWAKAVPENPLLAGWTQLLQARLKSVALQAGTFAMGNSSKAWDVLVFRRQAGPEQVVAALNLLGGNQAGVLVEFPGANLGPAPVRAVDLVDGTSFAVDEAKGALLLEFLPHQGRWLRLEPKPDEKPVLVAFEADLQGSVGLVKDGKAVWLTGDHAALGIWTPGAVALHNDGKDGDVAAGDTLWTVQMALPAGAVLAYKHGIAVPGNKSWENVEFGPDKPNRLAYAGDSDGNGTVRVRVLYAAAGPVQVIDP